MIDEALKVGISPWKKVDFIYFNENSLKMINSGFYFILKALFVLEIFKFLPRPFLILMENGLIRKLSQISKFMASQTWKLTVTSSILTDTLNSKDNQIIKFGLLIEHKMRD